MLNIKQFFYWLTASLFILTSYSAKSEQLNSTKHKSKNDHRILPENEKELEAATTKNNFLNKLKDLKPIEGEPRRVKYKYSYYEREHSSSETWRHIGGIYLLSLVVYPLFQPEVLSSDKGSFKKYGDNFGRIVFDQDEPFWNWIVHPISGSQLYLYYRANGYDRMSSIALTSVSSTLFEFTIETYSEPASLQDLYQTPIVGSLLGYGLEHLSLYFLNSANPISRVIGHILNPSTLFWYYEGRVTLYPTIGPKLQALNLRIEF